MSLSSYSCYISVRTLPFAGVHGVYSPQSCGYYMVAVHVVHPQVGDFTAISTAMCVCVLMLPDAGRVLMLPDAGSAHVC